MWSFVLAHGPAIVTLDDIRRLALEGADPIRVLTELDRRGLLSRGLAIHHYDPFIPAKALKIKMLRCAGRTRGVSAFASTFALLQQLDSAMAGQLFSAEMAAFGRRANTHWNALVDRTIDPVAYDGVPMFRPTTATNDFSPRP